MSELLLTKRPDTTNYCIIDMNTYGGAVDAPDSIRTAILKAPFPVISFVNTLPIFLATLLSNKGFRTVNVYYPSLLKRLKASFNDYNYDDVIDEITDFLFGLKMTILSGIFLLIAVIFMIFGIDTPIYLNPAWGTVIISGIPMLLLAMTRLIREKWISSALLIAKYHFSLGSPVIFVLE